MRIPRESLAIRLGVVSVLQVAALVLVASLSIPLSRYLQDRESPLGVAQEVARALRDANPIQPVLDGLRTEHDFDLSLYDASGKVLASNVSSPLSLRARGLEVFLLPPDAPDVKPIVPEGPIPRPPPPPGLLAPLIPPWVGSGRPNVLPVMVIPIRAGGVDYSLALRPPKYSQPFVPLLLTLAVGALVVTLGAVLTARFITIPLERLSKVVGAFGAGEFTSRSDIERRDEVGVLATTFNQMADRIQNMRETERELLHNVAHELRTPLARIGVALEIAEESDGANAKSALLGIREDLHELEGLLEDVLTASRLQSGSDAGRWVFRPQPFPLDALVSSLQSRFTSHHPERSLHVTSPEADVTVFGDEVLLRRAVSNLLENAHKYSPDNQSAVWLRINVDRERYTFEVEDHGTGIAPGERAKVFLPFYRSEQSRSKSSGGVGLGLTLARRIAEAHGGSLDLESNLGKGTLVRLSVPLQTAKDRRA